MIVLYERKIEVREARPDQAVAARVSDSRSRSGKREALCLDVMQRIAGIDGRLATWPEYPVREIKRIRGLQTERIPSDLRRKRQAAADLVDPANLPPAREPANAILIAWARNLPNYVEHSILTDIKV